MIPPSLPRVESPSWQRALADAVTEPAELLRLLQLDPGQSLPAHWPGAAFPLRVPRYFVGLMRPGDPADPLLLQVLPQAAEDVPVDGFVDDPVGDLDAVRDQGLLQKYRGRALMIATGACAVHCRYCFRRHFPYAEHNVLRGWTKAFRQLTDMHDTTELILSGGDPLSLSDARLDELLRGLERVPQLQTLRIHTRLPVVLPSRVTPQLVDRLSDSRLQTVLVIHANHPHEITAELGAALGGLAAGGTLLLNQSVLLKSVNDDADTLATLSASLLRIGVLPYYLHLLDPVAGAAHFAVATATAERLAEALRLRLPGYLVPRLVREVPGAPYKVPLMPR